MHQVVRNPLIRDVKHRGFDRLVTFQSNPSRPHRAYQVDVGDDYELVDIFAWLQYPKSQGMRSEGLGVGVSYDIIGNNIQVNCSRIAHCTFRLMLKKV